jgi:hypothetical protein
MVTQAPLFKPFPEGGRFDRTGGRFGTESWPFLPESADVTSNAIDRRSVIITLTQKGREKLVQAKAIAEEIANQVMLKIGKTNITSMNKHLNILKRNAIDGIAKYSKNKYQI